jgi:hypothetical protein
MRRFLKTSPLVRTTAAVNGGKPDLALPSQLVADLPQEILPPLNLPFIFDALRREPVHHAQDAPALIRFGQDDLGGLAVAQKLRHTSGTIFSVFSTFSG